MGGAPGIQVRLAFTDPTAIGLALRPHQEALPCHDVRAAFAQALEAVDKLTRHVGVILLHRQRELGAEGRAVCREGWHSVATCWSLVEYSLYHPSLLYLARAGHSSLLYLLTPPYRPHPSRDSTLPSPSLP